MNHAEAVMLCRYVRAICPAQKFDEYTPDVWHDLLGEYDFADCKEAARIVGRQQPFISPSEIIAEVRSIRANRIAVANVVYDGNPDESPIQSVVSLRQLVQAAGDGQLPARPIRAALESAEPHTELPAGRAKAILAAVGEHIPRRRDGAVNVFSVPCPICQARPGRPCTSPNNPGRRRADPHPARLEDARRAAAGQPPVDRAEVEREIQRRKDAAAAALAALPPGTITEPDDGFDPDAQIGEAS